ncbi:hypothetical protein BN946_scf184857.g37 [Trametes cinnabarina]|uniref:Uncharacterized protein n=1 Tax=Pycnoporus cinnabarinus TaxID=5643 RepID=A0A060SST6_PYCCI|nr:hypothetical protein BN946_scf184857.g37 [Trametes cinnabarina]
MRPTVAPAVRRDPGRQPRHPPRVRQPPIGERVVPPSETGSQAGPPPVMPMPTPGPTGPGPRPVSGPDIDFEEHVRRLRDQRRPGTGGWFQADRDRPQRPPTAPPAMETGPAEQSWYLRPETQADAQPQAQAPSQQAAPPPGVIYPPQPPQAIPVAAGPTIVQLPSTFNDILELLRDNRNGQIAGMEQQSEVINYLRGLNQWLERDVHDRHAEIESVTARLEQTRDEVLGLLNQVANALRREGQQAGPSQPPGQSIVVPPVVTPGQVYPPGHIPFGVQQGQQADRPVWPQEHTPPPGAYSTQSNVVPPPPERLWGPVIPPDRPHPDMKMKNGFTSSARRESPCHHRDNLGSYTLEGCLDMMHPSSCILQHNSRLKLSLLPQETVALHRHHILRVTVGLIIRQRASSETLPRVRIVAHPLPKPTVQLNIQATIGLIHRPQEHTMSSRNLHRPNSNLYHLMFHSNLPPLMCILHLTWNLSRLLFSLPNNTAVRALHRRCIDLGRVAGARRIDLTAITLTMVPL